MSSNSQCLDSKTLRFIGTRKDASAFSATHFVRLSSLDAIEQAVARLVGLEASNHQEIQDRWRREAKRRICGPSELRRRASFDSPL